MIFLKQSTASQEVPLGFFVDSTDGNTEETGLTIANTDIKVWKTGATTLANKNSGGATHISNGIYYAVLDATDTDTLGPLVIFVHVSGALTVRLECCVLAANVYDSFIAATDKLDVNTAEISGTTVSTSSAQIGVNVVNAGGTAWASGAITSGVFGSGAITAAAIAPDAIGASELAADAVTEIAAGVWNSARATYTSAGSFGEGVASVQGNVTGSVNSVTTGVTVTTNNDKTGYSLTQAFPTNFSSLAITAGGAVTAGTVSDKTGYSLTQSFPTNFSSLSITAGGAVTVGTNNDKTGYALTQSFPTNFAALSITAGGEVTVGTNNDKTGYTLTVTPPTSADIADAVWDEDLSGHATAGSAGKALSDAGAAGDPWSTAVPGAYSAGSAGYILGTNLDATVSSRSTLTAAAVNTEVVDALNVDTYAEPGSGAPGATVSLAQKIGYLYKAFRNKVTQTSTEYKLFADDEATVHQKATVNDDGTTFTRGEVGGP